MEVINEAANSYHDYKQDYAKAVLEYVLSEFASYGIILDDSVSKITADGNFENVLNNIGISILSKITVFDDFNSNTYIFVLEKFLKSTANNYVNSHTYDVKNKILVVHKASVGLDSEKPDTLHLNIFLNEKGNMPQANWQTIDEVAKGIGFEDIEGPLKIVYGTNIYDSYIDISTKGFFHQLPPGTSFPYWDRFKRVKGIKKN